MRNDQTQQQKKPYFEVLGADLFQKRPGTAQVKAAKQARYKRELEEQLAQQKKKTTTHGRRAQKYQQPEFIIDAGSNALPGAIQQQPAAAPQQPVRVPSPPPPRISNEVAPPPTIQSQSTPHISSYQLPPGYTGQPIVINQSSPPTQKSLELSSAIGKSSE